MTPQVDTVDVETNVTATFQVGLATDRSIIGRIEWAANDVSDTTPMVVKLLSFADGHVKSTDYYLLQFDEEKKFYDISCIHIPTSVNTSIKAEVYRINSSSCDCDITNMAASNCLGLCQMDFISSYNFQASKDACVLYRKSHQDDLTMNLMGEMISNDVTRFIGYFSNVNPFSSAFVSLFPDDERHFPHVPIYTFQARIDEHGRIYFSVDADNMGYFHFYAKLQLRCSNEHISVDYISESVKIKPYVQEAYTDESGVYSYGDTGSTASENRETDTKKNTAVLYGVMVGILITACIITVIVWVQVVRRKRRSRVSSRQRLDKDQNTQLYSPSILYTVNNSPNMTTTTKEVMVLAHPDTTSHEKDVEDLVSYLHMHEINVHYRPETRFQNWRDFAEKVGEEYENIIIVLSRGLIELCEIYKSKDRSASVKIKNDIKSSYSSQAVEYKQSIDNRWYKLLDQRYGEYIPCVAMDKIRTVIQDRRSNVRIHFITFCDTNVHCTPGEYCDENISGSLNTMGFKHFVDVCPNSKPRLTEHPRTGQQQEHRVHHRDDDLIHPIKNNIYSYNYTIGDLESFLKSRDQDYVWDFIKHNSFLQTNNTYFYSISRNVLKYLILSESDNNIDDNLLSVVNVLKELK